MGKVIPSVDRQLDDQGCISADLACVRCGYDLRGLAPGAVCPECGVPIERSLRGDLLRYCDPAWVGQLAKGMHWLVRGINCIVGTVILLFVVGVGLALVGLIGSLGSGTVLSVLEVTFGFALLAMLLFGVVTTLIGNWWLTAPDPTRLDEEQGRTARLAGRWGLIVAVDLLVLAASVEFLSRIAATVLLFSAEAAAIIGCAGFLTHLARMSLRLPDADLRSQTDSAKRTLVGVLLFHLGLPVLMYVAAKAMSAVPSVPGDPMAPGTGGLTAANLSSCLNAVLMVALLGSASQTLRIVMRYRKRLQQTWEESKGNWAAANAEA